VVLIGAETSNRQYVTYEIVRSLEHGNGVLGIRINNIKDMRGNIDPPGPIPSALLEVNAPVYDYAYGKLGAWVEDAFTRSRAV
jgi:hypothetical protein